MSFLLQKRLQLLKESLLPFELTHSGWFALPIYPSWHLQTWDVREWPWRFNFPSKQNECAIFPFMCIPHGSLLSYMLWCGHFLQSVGKKKQGQTCHTIAPRIQPRSQILSYSVPGDGEEEDLETKLPLVLFFIIVMPSPQKSEAWNRKSRESVVAPTIGWFSNITGTLVDDGARKSNNWLDRWLNGKLGTGSRVYM